MDEKILAGSGLTSDQAKIYLFLLRNGLSSARIISSRTGIGRALVYKVLEQLKKLALVDKRDIAGKSTLFSPNHPQRIKDLLLEQQKKLELASFQLKSGFGDIASAYNLLTGKPNVQFLEGAEGLRQIYADILDTNQDIRVISSPIDEGRKDILHLIREQIELQAAKNIKAKVINPFGTHEPTTPISEDKKNLITRKIVPPEKLHIPAQVIIYGDKVAITNFKEEIINVVIESKYIKETFEKVFDFIWEHC